MMIFQHRIPWSGGMHSARRRDCAAEGVAGDQAIRAQGRRIRSWATTFVGCLTGPAARRRVASSAANVGILGGIVCTPFVSMFAWVGMVLPTQTALHQLAPALMTVAVIWLALAIIGAHACRTDRCGRAPTLR